MQKFRNASRLALFGAASTLALSAHAEEAESYPDWSGPYVGANVGFGGFGTNVTDLASDMFDGEGSEMNVLGNGAIAGGQIGYNAMAGRFVFGVETDFQWTSYDKRTSTDDDDHRAGGEWNWFGTVRARGGITDQNTLFYLTGGVGYVNAFFCGADQECVTDGDEDLAFDSTEFAYAGGAGVETRISDHLSVKAEYLYIDVPAFDESYDGNDHASFSTQGHTFRVGINYHLGGLGGSAGAVTPRYSPFDGPYVGLNAGFGGFGTGVTDLADDMFDGEGSEMNMFGNGAVFGGQVGYNKSLGNFVVGVEADIQATSYSETSVTDDGDHLAQGAWNWFSTVRARAGATVGDTFFYGTGGPAIINADFCGADDDCVTDGDEDLAFTDTRLGYAVGAGVETKLTDNVSVKGEYLFVEAPDFEKSYDGGEEAEFGTSAHLFRIGLNYAF